MAIHRSTHEAENKPVRFDLAALISLAIACSAIIGLYAARLGYIDRIFENGDRNQFAESESGVISRIDRGKIRARIHDFPDVSILGSV